MRCTLVAALAALALVACRGEEEPVDEDLDGYALGVDCNDADAAVNPDADETCDGIDNDCDGSIDVDPSDAGTWYADADADGYGAAASVAACDAPEGYVGTGGDCDDGAPDVHPGAAEEDCADPVDYNCDGSVGYADGDGDGFAACEDCDDAAAAVSPNAVEICDGIDNDCDDEADEAGAVGAAAWYADADGDSYGDPDVTATACDAPAGHVADRTDCDDAAASTHPGAPETCNEVDDDCDGDADENPTDAGTWYADADADGAGGSTFSVKACARPEGYQASSDDCDDLDAASHPGATEVCDGADNDCDGALPADEADGDGDGFMGCAKDCADADPKIFPGASELCNDIDDDCDGTPDDNPVDEGVFYADEDGDGHGRLSTAIEACDAPTGFVESGDDCDDDDDAVSPSATEVPDNGIDDDCDGNQPPEPAPVARITPAHPGDDQALVCRVGVATTTTDPDGDPVSYLIDWTVDGSSWSGATGKTVMDGDTIAAADTKLGEKWACELTPTDGEAEGTSASASVVITEWLDLSAGKSCTNWSGSGVTQVHCGQDTPNYDACVTFCKGVDSSSMVHWGNQNGDYVAWGSVIAVSYELCDGDTTCDDGDDDNFWSKYSPTRPQEYCQADGSRMTCGSSWWTNGTGPTRCFCYR